MIKHAPLLLLALVAGCTSPSGPGRTTPFEGTPVPVDFRLGGMRLAIYPAFYAATHGGSLLIGGSLRTPCAPYEASAEARRSGSTLVLIVRGENRGDCPQDVLGAVLYDALLPDLPPGTNQVRIFHEWKDTGWPTELVFQSEVTL